jgi:hypothetical protein
MYSLQTLHINMSYVFSWNSSYTHVDMFLWRVWRECIGHVYMKSLKRIHRTCVYEEFEENTLDMFIWREYIGHVYMVFSSNASYKHVVCILLKLFIYTCPMYSLQTLHITCPMYFLQTLHINISYAFFSNSSYKHVLCILFKLLI